MVFRIRNVAHIAIDVDAVATRIVSQSGTSLVASKCSFHSTVNATPSPVVIPAIKLTRCGWCCEKKCSFKIVDGWACIISISLDPLSI